MELIKNNAESEREQALPDLIHAQEKVIFTEEAWIDLGILDTIILLNKKGYRTMNSCEGGWLDENDGYKTGAKNKNENKDGMKVINEVGSDFVPMYCTFVYPYQQLIQSTLPPGFNWVVFSDEDVCIESCGMMGIYFGEDQEQALEYHQDRFKMFHDWAESLPEWSVE